jgi:hypothetical protein
MKSLKIALGSFFVGAVLSLAPIVAYASCDQEIWVQDSPDCHMYHRYVLTGSNCGDDVCVCSYAQTSSVHREDSCGDGNGPAPFQ